jgi:hypothetical protein
MQQFVAGHKYPHNNKDVVENEPYEHRVIEKREFPIKQTAISSLAEETHKHIDHPCKLP